MGEIREKIFHSLNAMNEFIEEEDAKLAEEDKYINIVSVQLIIVNYILFYTIEDL